MVVPASEFVEVGLFVGCGISMLLFRVRRWRWGEVEMAGSADGRHGYVPQAWSRGALLVCRPGRGRELRCEPCKLRT